MDFIIRLPKSCRKDTILVVVDHLSKYGHFIALKHPYSARTITEVFEGDSEIAWHSNIYRK